jgi:hypothetical protein
MHVLPYISFRSKWTLPLDSSEFCSSEAVVSPVKIKNHWLKLEAARH